MRSNSNFFPANFWFSDSFGILEPVELSIPILEPNDEDIVLTNIDTNFVKGSNFLADADFLIKEGRIYTKRSPKHFNIVPVKEIYLLNEDAITVSTSKVKQTFYPGTEYDLDIVDLQICSYHVSRCIAPIKITKKNNNNNITRKNRRYALSNIHDKLHAIKFAEAFQKKLYLYKDEIYTEVRHPYIRAATENLTASICILNTSPLGHQPAQSSSRYIKHAAPSNTIFFSFEKSGLPESFDFSRPFCREIFDRFTEAAAAHQWTCLNAEHIDKYHAVSYMSSASHNVLDLTRDSEMEIVIQLKEIMTFIDLPTTNNAEINALLLSANSILTDLFPALKEGRRADITDEFRYLPQREAKIDYLNTLAKGLIKTHRDIIYSKDNARNNGLNN